MNNSKTWICTFLFDGRASKGWMGALFGGIYRHLMSLSDVYAYVHMYTYVYKHVDIYACAHVFIWMCIHIYIYMYMYEYVLLYMNDMYQYKLEQPRMGQ